MKCPFVPNSSWFLANKGSAVIKIQKFLFLIFLPDLDETWSIGVSDGAAYDYNTRFCKFIMALKYEISKRRVKRHSQSAKHLKCYVDMT